MNKAQAYLDQHKASMNQKFKNATGSTSNYKNLYGTGLANTPGATGMKPAGWNANGSANALPSAKPFLLQISNGSASAVSNFDVFGAAQYLFGSYGGGTWSAAGNFTLNGVTISIVSGGITYQQFLANTQNSPFTVGLVYLQSTTGSAQQVSDTYQLTSVSASGQTYTEPITPFIDPNQFQSGITVNNNMFNITALTKLTWTTIYASAVFQLRFFPSQQIDTAGALNGQSPQQVNGAPRVVGTLR